MEDPRCTTGPGSSSETSPRRRSRGKGRQWGRHACYRSSRRSYNREDRRQRLVSELLDFSLTGVGWEEKVQVKPEGWFSQCRLPVMEQPEVEQQRRHRMQTKEQYQGFSESQSDSHSADECHGDFALLPFDVLRRIAGALTWPNLWSASRVCRTWHQALTPLREGMLFLQWGKKFKHGRGGVSRNPDKALESFIKGALRGCAAAMVDAGLMLWDLGRREEGMRWYRLASELGDPAGRCNLGLAFLLGGEPAEAVKWLQLAATAGHVRAQYSLALCFQQGRGCEASAAKAAGWYLRAAEGGSLRAMYNTALCYREGEGVAVSPREAKWWMQRAAEEGHARAQFEHGLALFAEGHKGLALVFLELATRAGETAAAHVRDVLLVQLPPLQRAKAITRADNYWQDREVLLQLPPLERAKAIRADHYWQETQLLGP